MATKKVEPQKQTTQIVKTCSLCGSTLNSKVKFRSFKHLDGRQTYACHKCTWDGAGLWSDAMEEIDGIFTELGKLRAIPMGDIDTLLDVWDEIHYGLLDELSDKMERLEDKRYDD